MSTTLLNPAELKDLQPATELWAHDSAGNAPFAFTAQSERDARSWQDATRSELAAAVGFQDEPAVAPQPQVIETVDRGDHVREKILIRTSAHSLMPVYLLLPKKHKDGPLPVVLAFHGHGYGVKDIVGLWEDGEERHEPDGYHKDFAIALCRRGFAVAAPEIACFGERQTDFSYLNGPKRGDPATTCTHSAMLAFHLGKSVIGMRVRDSRRLVDYLASRPETDTERLGAMGISGGGSHAFFSTCLDTRIKASVVSGYFCPFRHSILAMHHCACNFVPGLHRFGEITDLVGLIAPRPMLVEAANYDPIFPIDAVKPAVEDARRVFGVFGADGYPETDYFEGRHQISGKKAYDFLAKHLAQ